MTHQVAPNVVDNRLFNKFNHQVLTDVLHYKLKQVKDSRFRKLNAHIALKMKLKSGLNITNFKLEAV